MWGQWSRKESRMRSLIYQETESGPKTSPVEFEMPIFWDTLRDLRICFVGSLVGFPGRGVGCLDGLVVVFS